MNLFKDIRVIDPLKLLDSALNDLNVITVYCYRFDIIFLTVLYYFTESHSCLLLSCFFVRTLLFLNFRHKFYWVSVLMIPKYHVGS